MWPTKGTVGFKLLEVVKSLSGKCVGGRVPVTEIYLEMDDRPRESIRTTLSQLKIRGFVSTPMRGMYIVSKKGEKLLEEEGE